MSYVVQQKEMTFVIKNRYKYPVVRKAERFRQSIGRLAFLLKVCFFVV